ncbi:MAG: acyltransferase family protein [Acidimicrobiales bacterium]
MPDDAPPSTLPTSPPDGSPAPATAPDGAPVPGTGVDPGTGQKRTIVPVVDGFRGISALLILLYHAFYYAGQPVLGGGSLRSLVGGGYVAVDFFFVISGFVLFLPTALSGGNFGPVRPYAIRRIARIVPAYYVFLFAVVVLHRWLSAVPTPLPVTSARGTFSALLHVAFFQHNIGLLVFLKGAGIMPEGFGVLTVVWTLNLEALFYLCLPLVAGWYYRHPFVGFVVALAVTVTWRMGATHTATSLAWLGAGSWAPAKLYTVSVILVTQMPNYVVNFAAGMTAAWLFAWLRPRWTARAAARVGLPVQVLSFVALVLLVRHEGHNALTHLTAYYIWTRSTPIALVFAVLVLSTSFSVRWAQWPVSNPVSRWLGDVSYGIYLAHIIVIGFAVTTLGIVPTHGSTVMRSLMAVTLPATLVLAWLSWTFVEQPARAWARRRTRRPRALPVAAPAASA